MQAIHSLLALHADFSFQAPPTSESKWSVFLSSSYPRKVHKCLSFGGSKASFFLPPLDSIHPMPWRFRPHSSKSPWPHLGVCSKSHLHTWFPAVASCIESMVWTCTNGLHEPLPTLIKLLIVIGRVSVDFPLQTVGLGCDEKFLQKLSLKFGLISYCSWPQ